ncbi:MAG TPA: hypothetical protein VMH32_11875 [Burkholderiales bacterium]|nr:hypothetical protein [Burkholderiales bacterium]
MTAKTLAAAYAAAASRAAQVSTQATAPAANRGQTQEPSAPQMPGETILMRLLRHSLSPSDQIMARKALSGATPWQSGRG